MNKLFAKYESWTEMGKNLFILVVIAIVGVIASIPFIFLENVGVLLGWLLGSAVNLFAYVSMAKGSHYILSNSSSAKYGYLAMAWALLRILLYVGALVLAGFASFRWGSLSHGYCNLISLALALMPTWLTLVFGTMLRHARAERKNMAKPAAPKPEEPKPEAPVESEPEQEAAPAEESEPTEGAE